MQPLRTIICLRLIQFTSVALFDSVFLSFCLSFLLHSFFLFLSYHCSVIFHCLLPRLESSIDRWYLILLSWASCDCLHALHEKVSCHLCDNEAVLGFGYRFFLSLSFHRWTVTTETLKGITNMGHFVSALHFELGHYWIGYSVSADDEKLVQALEAYHWENLSSNKKIVARLWTDHGIKMRYVDVGIFDPIASVSHSYYITLVYGIPARKIA